MPISLTDAKSMAQSLIDRTAAGAGRTTIPAAAYQAFGSDIGVAHYLNSIINGKNRSKLDYDLAPDTQTKAPTEQGSTNTNVTPPTYMTWDEAMNRASGLVNPTFDIQRSGQEQQYSKEREEMPQYMAAKRGGAVGLKGGMYQSAMSGLTQKEAAAKDKLEAQRTQVLNQTANDLMNDTNSQALAKWQAENSLALQQSQMDYQKKRDAILDERYGEDSSFNKALSIANLNRILGLDEQNAEHWNKDFALKEGDYTNSPEYNDIMLQKTRAELDRILNPTRYSRTGTGGQDEDAYGNYDYYTSVIDSWLSRGDNLASIDNAIGALSPKQTGLTQSQLNALKDYAKNANLPGYSKAFEYFGLNN